MRKSVIGYMCKTDFDYELGDALDGATVYPSLSGLKKYRKCHSKCGAVKVQVSLVKVIKKGKIK